MSRPQPPTLQSGRYSCAFDLALLAGCAGCSCAEKTPVGEQIVVYCRARNHAENCHAWLGRLRQNAGFALPALRGAVPMTHAQAMRLRCGGLRGLASQADGITEDAAIGDVAALLAGLSQEADTIAWERVIRAVTAWRPPGRRGRN